MLLELPNISLIFNEQLTAFTLFFNHSKMMKIQFISIFDG